MNMQQYPHETRPTYPCLIYGMFTNPDYNKPFTVKRPSREEWETLRGLEPTKIVMDYEKWADSYVKGETAVRKIRASCQLQVLKFAINSGDDPIIAELEARPDFTRWIA